MGIGDSSAAWLRFRARDSFDRVAGIDRAIGREPRGLKSACLNEA
jgi:hypothetical protein